MGRSTSSYALPSELLEALLSTNSRRRDYTRKYSLRRYILYGRPTRMDHRKLGL